MGVEVVMKLKQNTYEIPFRGERKQILTWLMRNISYHSLTPSGLSVVDVDGKYIWWINLTNNNDKVLFTREEDAVMFALRWS